MEQRVLTCSAPRLTWKKGGQGVLGFGTEHEDSKQKGASGSRRQSTLSLSTEP